MVQPRSKTNILLVVGLLGVMLMLGLGLFIRPVRHFVLAWLVVDLGLVTVWLLGAIVYFLFKNKGTKPQPRSLKVDFGQSRPETPELKINGQIPSVPVGKTELTVKHG